MTSILLPQSQHEALEAHSLQAYADEPVFAASAPSVKASAMSFPGTTVTNVANASIGVAVLDTGVSDHSDLTVASRHNIVSTATAETLEDGFDSGSYNGSEGITTWAQGWTEVNDNGSASSGVLSLVTADNSKVLKIRPTGSFAALDRPVDLAGAQSASMRFKWRSTRGTTAVTWVEVYTPSTGWDIIHTIPRVREEEVWQQVTLDLTPYISSNTIISFSTSDARYYETHIDDVVVDYTVPSSEADGYGHGTHIAGIIGGKGNASSVGARGIVKGAAVHSVRVLDSHGRGYLSDVIAGLEWVLNNAQSRAIRVANLSLGKAIEQDAADDPLVQAVEALWDAGIVVVVSAGNYGEYGSFTITSPGNSPKVITVGSADDGDTPGRADDGVASYSSRARRCAITI
jgi:subtilisin family serine protease